MKRRGVKACDVITKGIDNENHRKRLQGGALGYIGCELKVTDSCLTANNREEDKQSQGESERENSLQTYE